VSISKLKRFATNEEERTYLARSLKRVFNENSKKLEMPKKSMKSEKNKQRNHEYSIRSLRR
jgi:hypothetical protein